MTNHDRIKNMSSEELAEFFNYADEGNLFVGICDEKYCKDCIRGISSCPGDCKPAIIKWLESEAK